MRTTERLHEHMERVSGEQRMRGDPPHHSWDHTPDVHRIVAVQKIFPRVCLRLRTQLQQLHTDVQYSFFILKIHVCQVLMRSFFSAVPSDSIVWLQKTSHLIERPGSGDDVPGAAFKQQAEVIPYVFFPQILRLQEHGISCRITEEGELGIMIINESNKPCITVILPQQRVLYVWRWSSIKWQWIQHIITLLFNKWILLFSEDTFNWSEVTLNINNSAKYFYFK